ncbi:putative surface protein with fasciclin (FAS1) repeats [Lentzea atacamensis]|uniref:Fasciclin domain-containing protein n=3 Tax=Pseudonocardiaceae TaxID=2070 RepID=A0ABP7ARB1_9PSEU|nr:putative surface protein with fasciclin (FAS1) repeats [Lentzea atacamensis]
MRKTLAGVFAIAIAGLAACSGMDQPSTATNTPTTTSEAAMGMTRTSDVFGPGCAGVPQDGKGSLNGMAEDPVATAASNNPLLTKLVAAVKAANLADTLNSQQAITVFAPADPAFAELGDAKFQELAGNPAALTPILQYHVVPMRYDAKGLEAAKTVKTLAGQDVTIAGSGDNLTVNGAPVLCGNIPTKNATVFVIGKVLTP